MASLECFKGSNPSMWLQIVHGFFGVGGLLGPLVVYTFELHTMTVIGIGTLFLVPFYLIMPSPQQNPEDESTQ